MVTFFISFFSIIGGTVVVWFLFDLIREIIRALRNGHRVATVAVRPTRRFPTFRQWMRGFWYEFTGSHSSIIIRRIEIPRNHREPLKARRYY